MFNNVKTHRNINYSFFFFSLIFLTYIFVYPCYELKKRGRGKLGSKSNWVIGIGGW